MDRCPICGLPEQNDGSEETLYICECDEDDELGPAGKSGTVGWLGGEYDR